MAPLITDKATFISVWAPAHLDYAQEQGVTVFANLVVHDLGIDKVVGVAL
jgi:hypothetical protein